MLLIYTHTIEGCEAERADLEVGDFLAQRLEHRRVGNRHDRDLMLKDLLCLLVQIDPLLFVSGHFGLLNQFLVRRVAPLGVVATFHRGAAVEHAEPVIRVAVVAMAHKLMVVPGATPASFSSARALVRS